jgi:serine/threonine-protein kinase
MGVNPLAIKCGDTLGDYKVIDLAGFGGMGAVYKIEHVITKRVEAMKVLPTGIDSDPEDVKRFEREIEVQARLHHPGVVALYNAVRDDQSIALIMEYVDGESLQHLLERERLPLQTAVDYAGQVLDALAYVHDKGVIHRDVTPANIIITPEGTARLTDFGLALPINDPRMTRSGVPVGSAWYMSPEQVKALDQLDARADLYAMGAVLHEMLTGRKLFDEDGTFAVMCAQMEAVPQPPSAFNPEVPTALDEVVGRALAKDPRVRFQRASEFRIALDAATVETPPCCAVSEVKAAPRTARWQNAGAADSKPLASPKRFPGSRAPITLLLASAALAIVACMMVLRAQAARFIAGKRVPTNVVSISAHKTVTSFVADPRPSAFPVAVQVPETRMEAVKPSPLPATHPPLVIRQAAKKAFAVRLSGGPQERILPRPSLQPPTSVPAETTEASAAEMRLSPPSTTASTSETLAEPEAITLTAEEPIPPKKGNRFVRALRKLNPFHKRAQNHSADHARVLSNQSVDR